MEQMERLEKKMKFALFGHGFHLCYLMRLLVDQGFEKPVIITHPRESHERDRRLLNDLNLYQYLFEVAEELDVKVIEVDKVNQQSVIDFLKDQECDIGFSLSCRSIIKKEIIDFFSGNIFNLHPTFLPNERGGGTFSWRILNDEKEVSATLHYIDMGIDSGNIVLQDKKIIDIDFPKPYDYMAETNIIYKSLLDDFLNNIESFIKTDGVQQKDSESTYFPRLITETNGAIDWSIKGDYIERVIRAFSDPYPGAWSFLNGAKVSIMDSFFEENNHGMHPLMNGKIIQHTEKSLLKVVVDGGYLYVSRINNHQTNMPISSELIHHPGQFYTSTAQLETAKYKTSKVSQINVEN